MISRGKVLRPRMLRRALCLGVLALFLAPVLGCGAGSSEPPPPSVASQPPVDTPAPGKKGKPDTSSRRERQKAVKEKSGAPAS